MILNGSPRKTGNTSALVKAFTEGAERAGHAVTEFFLDGMTIHGCKGCFGGHSSQEVPCVQRDDMAQIYPAVKGCDVVVLASPLYYWTMSGQLRTALDRLFALAMGYGLTALLVRPDWNFWLCLIPGLLCLYFRLLHARACDADRKAGSPQSASGPL